MNTYRKQSRKPNPVPAQRLIDEFVKNMDAAGYTALPVYNPGKSYTPTVEIALWPKRETEAGR